MLITANPVTLESNLKITKPIAGLDLIGASSMIEFFDKDGFDLNEFERVAYVENDVPTIELLNRTAYQQKWLNDPFDGKSGVRVDHAVVAARLPYEGQARKQIEHFAYSNPLLNRLLQVKPKWGLDFNLEYIFDDGFTVELLHVEEDFYDYTKFKTRLIEVEKNVCFFGFANWAHAIRDTYYTGDAEVINDNKARLFGFPRAYSTLKVI